MKVENFVPQVYYRESRDFAFIGRLIELAINYSKTAADNVNVRIEPNVNMDNYLLQLLADTLGFKLKHNYNTKDLLYICTSLYTLYKKKGSMEAIQDAVQILVNSQQIPQKVIWKQNLVLDSTTKNLTLKIPASLTDLVLIEDLFDYILPAGITYSFMRVSNEAYNAKDNLSETVSDDQITSVKLTDLQAGGLFEVQTDATQSGQNGSIYLGNIGSTVVVETDDNTSSGGN